jgi:hypothetical protein
MNLKLMKILNKIKLLIFINEISVIIFTIFLHYYNYIKKKTKRKKQ